MGHRCRQKVCGVMSVQASSTWGRIVALVVGNEQGGVPDQATSGRNKLCEESIPHQ